jgi:hypothetical protein
LSLPALLTLATGWFDKPLSSCEMYRCRIIGAMTPTNIGKSHLQGLDMEYGTIKYEIDDGLLKLTLSRPEKMNAVGVRDFRNS